MAADVWPRLSPAGDSAVLVQFGDAIDAHTNAQVHRLAAGIARANWEGFGEPVPAYSSLLVHYDLLVWDYSAAAKKIENLLPDMDGEWVKTGARLVEIPVVYGGEEGPDLEEVAAMHGITATEVIRLHSGSEYLVYMIGFTPGFPYLGGLDERIATPRRASPRTLVPAGSVGIAGQQTGVYPLASPGGWQIIGRTLLNLFDPGREPPSLLAPGDRVRFVPVERRP